MIKQLIAISVLGIAAIVSQSSVAVESEYIAPPPVQSLVDSHGIDMFTGTYKIPGMKLSIGKKESGLNIETTHSQRFHNTYTGTLTLRNRGFDSYDNPLYGLPEGSYLIVDALGRSEVFQGTEGEYTNSRKTGGRFNCAGNVCTYTITDGTVAIFDKTIIRKSGIGMDQQASPASVPNSAKSVGEMTKIIKNDGEVIDIFFYLPFGPNSDTKAIRAVRSSLGWMISFKYGYWTGVNSAYPLRGIATDSIQTINTSVEYCDPLAASCDQFTNSWHSASYSIDDDMWFVASGSSMMEHLITRKVTNPLGKSDNYTLSKRQPLFFAIQDSYRSFAGVSVTFKHSDNGCPYQPSACLPSFMYPVNAVTHSNGPTYNYSGAVSVTRIGPDGTFGIEKNTSRLSSYTDKLNRTWTYTYVNAWGNQIDKIIDPDATPNQTSPTGGYTQYTYDQRGNITSITVYPKNNSATPLLTSATYSEAGLTTCTNPKICNKPLTVTDQNGVTTSFDYYPEHGGIKTITKPAVNGVQAQTLYIYEQKIPYVKNSSGSLVASTSVWRLVSTSKCMTQTLNTCAGTADELRTEYSDFNNNLLSKKTTVKHGDGSVVLVTTRDYDIYGNVSWENGPRPGDYDTVYYFYDAMRQKIGEIGVDPDGSGPLPRQSTRIGYNDDGKVNSVEKGTVLGTDKSSLDAMVVQNQSTTEYSFVHGFPIFDRLFAGGVLKKLTQKSYDANLRLDCVAQRLSFSASLDACALGQASEVYSNTSVVVNDRVTKYAYDLAGAVTSTTSAYGTSLVRKDRVNVYDPANGLLQTESDGLGNVTTYTYDDFKRPSKTIYPLAANGTAKNDNDYTQKFYTKNYVSSIRLRDTQTITFNPDAIGRVGSKTGAVSETFTYNNFDQVSSHTNNTTGGTSATSTYKRKAIGWLEYEESALGKVGYDYDSYGRRTKLTWPDNVYVNYDYDVNGYAGDYLKKITESSGATIASFDYYDTGRRKTLTRGNGVVTNYAYDALQRIETYGTDVGGTSTTDDISETFSYTLSGQIKSRSLNAENAGYVYTPTVAATIGYVPNGLNQIASLNGATFGYDLRGNLTSENTGASYTYNANNLLLNSTRSGVTTTLSYDAENRLYNVVQGSTSTKFMYDGTDLVAETNSSNSIQRRYVHGPETDDPILWYEGSGTSDKRYYTADRQGSIVGVTLASGMQAFTNAYDEYGIQKNSNVGRFQYTGQTWIPEVGLYYYKARFYSPVLGRFLQTDPIGYKDNMNLYAYVGNDPVNKIDPTGMYGQGSGWSDDQWKKFDKAQQRAANDMEKRAGKLDAKADKLDSKGKTGGDSLRSTAEKLRGGVASLRSNGSDGKVANLVNGASYVAMGGSKEGGAFVPRSDRDIVVVNGDNQAAWTGSNAKWSIGHESLHSTGVGLNDQRGSNTERAYKQGTEGQRAAYEELKGTSAADINPDHIMDLVY